MIVAFQTFYFFRDSLCNLFGKVRKPYFRGFQNAEDCNEEDTTGNINACAYFDEGAGIIFSPPVYAQRYAAVIAILKERKWNGEIKKLADLGCNDCTFLKYAKDVDSIQTILGVDVALFEELQNSKEFIKYEDQIFTRDLPLKVILLHGNAADPDYRLMGCDAVTCIELIEHMLPHDLERLVHTLFGFIRPLLVIVTTPNADFNVLFPSMLANGFRNLDHKFEWSREQFIEWSSNIVLRYPEFHVQYRGVGPGPPGTEHLGCCTQLALFINCNYKRQPDITLDNLVTIAKQSEQINLGDTRLQELCNGEDPPETLKRSLPINGTINHKPDSVSLTEQRALPEPHSVKQLSKRWKTKDVVIQCNVNLEMLKNYLMINEDQEELWSKVIIGGKPRQMHVYSTGASSIRLNHVDSDICTQDYSILATPQNVKSKCRVVELLNFNRNKSVVKEQLWANINWGDNAPFLNHFYTVFEEYEFPFKTKSLEHKILDRLTSEIHDAVLIKSSAIYDPLKDQVTIPLSRLMGGVQQYTKDETLVRDLLQWNGYNLKNDMLVHTLLSEIYSATSEKANTDSVDDFGNIQKDNDDSESNIDDSESTRIAIEQIISEAQKIASEQQQAGNKLEFSTSTILNEKDGAAVGVVQTMTGSADIIEGQILASPYKEDIPWNTIEQNTKISYCDEMPECISIESASVIWHRCGCTLKKEFVQLEVEVLLVEENVRTLGTQTEFSFSTCPMNSSLESSMTCGTDTDSGVCHLSVPCTLSMLDSSLQSVTCPLYGDTLSICHDGPFPERICTEQSNDEENQFCGFGHIFKEPEIPNSVESKTEDFEQGLVESKISRVDQEEQPTVQQVNETDEDKTKLNCPTDVNLQQDTSENISSDHEKLTVCPSMTQECKNDRITCIFSNVDSHKDYSQPSTSRRIMHATVNVQCDTDEYESSKTMQVLSSNNQYSLRAVSPNLIIIKDEDPHKDNSTGKSIESSNTLKLCHKFSDTFLGKCNQEKFRGVSRIQLTMTEIGVQACITRRNLSHCLANICSCNERFYISKNQISFSGQWKELCDSKQVFNDKHTLLSIKNLNSKKGSNTCSSCMQSNSQRTSLKGIKIIISDENVKLRLQTTVERRKKYAQRLSRRRAFIMNRKLSSGTNQVHNCEKKSINNLPHYNNFPRKTGGDQVTSKELTEKSDEVVPDSETICLPAFALICNDSTSNHQLSFCSPSDDYAPHNTAKSLSNVEQLFENSKKTENSSFAKNENMEDHTSEVDRVNNNSNISKQLVNEADHSNQGHNYNAIEILDMASADRRILIEKRINKILLDKMRRQYENVYESAYCNETCANNGISLTVPKYGNAKVSFVTDLSSEGGNSDMKTASNTRNEHSTVINEPRSPTFSNAGSLHSSPSVNSIVTVIKNKKSYLKISTDGRCMRPKEGSIEGSSTIFCPDLLPSRQNIVEEVDGKEALKCSSLSITFNEDINLHLSSTDDGSKQSVLRLLDLDLENVPVESCIGNQQRPELLSHLSSITTFTHENESLVPEWLFRIIDDQQTGLHLGDQDVMMSLAINGTNSFMAADDLGLAGTSGAGDGIGVHNEMSSTSSDDVSSLASMSANELQLDHTESMELSSEDTIIDKVTEEYSGTGSLELTESRVRFYKSLNRGFVEAGTSAKLRQSETVASGAEADVSCSDTDGQDHF